MKYISAEETAFLQSETKNCFSETKSEIKNKQLNSCNFFESLWITKFRHLSFSKDQKNPFFRNENDRYFSLMQ